MIRKLVIRSIRYKNPLTALLLSVILAALLLTVYSPGTSGPILPARESRPVQVQAPAQSDAYPPPVIAPTATAPGYPAPGDPPRPTTLPTETRLTTPDPSPTPEPTFTCPEDNRPASCP